MELSLNLFVVLSNVVLGLFIFLKNPKLTTNRIFSLLTLVFALWTILNYMSLHATSPKETLFWIRSILFLAAFKPLLLFLLFHTYPRDKIALKKTFLLIVIIFPVLAAFLALTPLVFTGIKIVEGQPQPIPGLGMAFWALTFFSLLIFSFIALIKRCRSEQGLLRTQMLFMLFGFILSFTFFLFTNFIMVNVFHNSKLVILGPLFTIILISFIFYAIVKHRFLDIRLVIARTVAYSLLVTIISIFYIGAAFFFSTLFFGFTSQFNQLLVYMVLTLIVALSFERLKFLLEKITDGFFFKGRYDSSQLLSDLGHIMSTNIDLAPLSSQILKSLINEVRITRGAIILFDNTSVYDVVSEGFATSPTFSYAQITPLVNLHETIVFNELEEGNLKQLMRNLNFEAARVLRANNDIVGIVALGEKSSGEMYSDQDINVLNILGPEVAVAIQNAQSYDKIKKFNITLQEEIKKATVDLQWANARLKELDQLKDDFVSVASHELRTPMTAIRSYAWMALNRPDIPLSEKMKKYLGRTLISTERLINLVNDMLNVSRIESGRVEVKPAVFDIGVLVDDVVAEVGPKASEKMIHLQVKKDMISKVFADADKVHQVLLNLIGNSLKFTPNEGIIETSFFTDGQMVEVAVKDNGVGISKEDLSRLFKKFGRLDNSYVAAATSGGTGLGLYIAKSLVELMGGKIWVSSEGVGKGTTFTFSLPIATPATLAQAQKFTRTVEGEAKVLEPVTI